MDPNKNLHDTHSTPDKTKELYNVDQMKQYKMVGYMLIIATILALVFAFWQYFSSTQNSSAFTVYLDINPSIRLQVDDKNKVISAEGYNVEGEFVLGDSSFTNIPLEESLDAILGLLLFYGYIETDTNIFLSVEHKNQETGSALSVSLKEFLDTALEASGRQATVVGLWADPEFDLFTQAQAQGTSFGKIVLTEEISKGDYFLSSADLVQLTQGELYQIFLSGASKAPIGFHTAMELSKQAVHLSELDTYVMDIQARLSADFPYYYITIQTPSKELLVQLDAFTGTTISTQEQQILAAAPSYGILSVDAKKIALNHTDILELEAENLLIHQDWSRGRLYYIVTFQMGSNHHKVEIMGSSGLVVNHEISTAGASNVLDLGQSTIQEMVYLDAGLTAAQVSSTSVQRYLQDGQMMYEMRFWVSNREYYYKITGEGHILNSKFDDYGEEFSETTLTSISETAAKDMALAHAGTSFSQVNQLDVTRNADNNYEVTFMLQETPYHYTISAETGELLAFDKNEFTPSTTDEEPLYDSDDIGQEAAKQKALSHANLKEVMIQSFDITSEGEGEEKEYTIKFKFGLMDYTYFISATTGEIVDFYQNQQTPLLPQEPIPETPETPEWTDDQISESFDQFDSVFEDFDDNFSNFFS